MSKHKANKIIIISASGMGCTILASPLFRVLRLLESDSHITLLGISNIFVAPFSGSDIVDEIQVFDFPKTSLWNLRRLWSRIKFIKTLRKQHFDYSITLFPSNKWHFNLFASFIGASQRITHEYDTYPLLNFSFLQNNRIPVNRNLHDVDQNLNLLKAFGHSPEGFDKKPLFYISDQDRRDAAQFAKDQFDSNRKVVGMHIGSSQDFNFAAKRWPTEKFAALADRLQQELDAQVCIFAGPDESSELSKLVKVMNTTPIICQQPIKLTAALIEKCDLMISNDSGLMHIAVAMNTSVIAIFGPTNITRTRPYSENASLIYNEKCHSLLKYPFRTTSSNIDPEKAKKCFETISVERVFLKAKERLENYSLTN